MCVLCVCSAFVCSACVCSVCALHVLCTCSVRALYVVVPHNDGLAAIFGAMLEPCWSCLRLNPSLYLLNVGVCPINGVNCVLYLDSRRSCHV